MKTLLITFIVVLPSLAYCQVSIISGIIADFSGSGIPYASIIETQHRFGLLTDADGQYKYAVPDSLLSDSVKISCVGYESKTVQIATLTSHYDSVVSLVTNPIVLHEMTVTSSRAKYCATKHGCLSRKSRGGFLFRAGYEICLFIPALPGESEAVIGSVRYFIGKKGFPTSPFRITLYDVDSTTNGPGNSLLDTDTIVQAYKGGAWFEIDIRSFNIAVPPNGFFVGMQWLPEAQAYTVDFGKNQAEADGQSLGLMKDETQVMWLRNLTMDWWLNSMSDYYPMIGATISTECPDN